MSYQNGNGNGTEKKKLHGQQITLPETPDSMMRLAERVISAHASLGSASPVDNALATQIRVKYSLAKQKHEEAMLERPDSSDAMNERDVHLGLKVGKTPASDVSLRFYLQCTLEILLRAQDEKHLRQYGFID
jgi:hypothetical protein